MKILYFLLIPILLLAACATNENYRGNIEIKNTNENDMHLGMRYLTGHGLPQNDEKAFYYLLKAANNGNPFAQNEIGYLYAVGKGTPQNYTKAREFYQKASEQNLSSAQYTLGLFYQYGLGDTPQNLKMACRLFLKAKQAGFHPAKQAFLQHCDH